MSINPKKLPKTFAILPKWRNFAKFGHTSFESFITKMLSPRFPYILLFGEPFMKRLIQTSQQKKEFGPNIFKNCINEIICLFFKNSPFPDSFLFI